MNPFEEYCFGNDYVLRFYRVDHGLMCTINESMVSELREVEAKITKYQLRHAEQRKRIAELEIEIEAAEQQVLNAFERGKMFGYAEGLKKASEK